MSAHDKEPFCQNCPHFTRFSIGGRDIGLGVWTGCRQGFSTSSGEHYDALGAGHCEHPIRPRGLVLCTYVCKDHPDFQPSIRDVTPRTLELEDKP